MTYKKGNMVMSVTYVPRRKKKCLLIGDGLYYQKVASFDTDEDADDFEKFLEAFLGVKNDRTSRE